MTKTPTAYSGLSTADLVEELRAEADRQRREGRAAVAADERCADGAAAAHNDCAAMLDEAADRLRR